MIDTIDQEIEGELKRTTRDNPRQAAEVAYVLACRSRRSGDIARARHFCLEALRLLRGRKIDTFDEAAARLDRLGGVALPDLFHAEVVEAYLARLSLDDHRSAASNEALNGGAGHLVEPPPNTPAMRALVDSALGRYGEPSWSLDELREQVARALPADSLSERIVAERAGQP